LLYTSHESFTIIMPQHAARPKVCIAVTTLNIPHPYKEDDALNFLVKAGEDFRAGRYVSFAISIWPGRELCGAVGLNIAEPHWHAELGYWIGVPFWGRGYAT
jgi:[ribosomal protein S5]-alanine N-acetyltransferase